MGGRRSPEDGSLGAIVPSSRCSAMARRSKGNFQKLGRVVACRVITEADGDDRKITLSIGMPRRVDGDEWQCAILIEGLKASTIADSASGTDSLAALLLAVECVRWHLKESGGHFAWLGESDLWDTGIPRQVPIGFGRQFEERIERAIEREAENARKFRAPILRRLLAEAEPKTKHVRKTSGASTSSVILGKRVRRKR
jgi:hypothetical protein